MNILRRKIFIFFLVQIPMSPFYPFTLLLSIKCFSRFSMCFLRQLCPSALFSHSVCFTDADVLISDKATGEIHNISKKYTIPCISTHPSTHSYGSFPYSCISEHQVLFLIFHSFALPHGFDHITYIANIFFGSQNSELIINIIIIQKIDKRCGIFLFKQKGLLIKEKASEIICSLK